MHAFPSAKKTAGLFLLALIVLVSVCGIVAAQEEEAVTDMPMIPESDSLATAPNDSAEVADGIKELIRKEQSGFVNRVKRSGIGQNYIKGGNFMHPLLLASIIALVFIIERLWTLSRARVNVKKLMQRIIRNLREEGVQSALEVCQRTRGPIAAILHSGLLRADKGPDAVEKAIETAGTIEMSFLERGLVALNTIGTVAPLLGFLGTVSGMISAFAAIAAAEQVSAKLVAKGIQEALITTATGLIIAVPVTIGHNFFVSQIDRFIIEMEEASATVVNELIEMESGA